MTGRVKYPDHLFIRVDRPLRAALLSAAAAEGVSVSDLARRTLRASLPPRDQGALPSGAEAAR